MRCPQCNSLNASSAAQCRKCRHRLKSSSDVDPKTEIVRPRTATLARDEDLDDTIVSMTDSVRGKAIKRERSLLGDRYELMEELGRGGFAVVHRAYDTHLKRPVAIKSLLPAYLASEAASIVLSRFGMEAAAIAQLKHPNIVEVYDYHRDHETFYLVMEFIDGPTLRAYVEKKSGLDVVEALSLSRSIAKGLFYAHKNNLIHRDIKPSNVILTSEDGVLIPKIVDFGLARAGRAGSEASHTGYGMGTPGYMAPEQNADAKNVDHRADIYSLGKLLYVLLTGERAQDVIPNAIPEPTFLSRIIYNCIRPRVESRYFSMQGFLDDVSRGMSRLRTKESTMSMIRENTCPSCKASNDRDDRSCHSCGADLTQICPECGEDNSIHNRQCPSCKTDQRVFVVINRALREAREHGEGNRWEEMQKLIDGLPGDPALPGECGRRMLDHADELKRFVGEKLSLATELKSQLHRAIADNSPTVALTVMREYQAIIPGDHEVNALHDFLAEEKRIVEFGERLQQARMALDQAEIVTCRQFLDGLKRERHHPEAHARQHTVEKWRGLCGEFDAISGDLENSERSVEYMMSQAINAMDVQDYGQVQRLCHDIRGVTIESAEADRIRKRAENLLLQAKEHVVLARKAVDSGRMDEAEERAKRALAIQQGNSEALAVVAQIRQRENVRKKLVRVGAIIAAGLLVAVLGVWLAVRSSQEPLAHGPEYSAFDQDLAEAGAHLRGASELSREPDELLEAARTLLDRAATDPVIGELDADRRERLGTLKSQLRVLAALRRSLRELEQRAGHTQNSPSRVAALVSEFDDILSDETVPAWYRKRVHGLRSEMPAEVTQASQPKPRQSERDRALLELQQRVSLANNALRSQLPEQWEALQAQLAEIKAMESETDLQAAVKGVSRELDQLLVDAKRRQESVRRYRDALNAADRIMAEMRQARDVRRQKELAGTALDQFLPSILALSPYVGESDLGRHRNIERQARVIIDSPIPEWDEIWREARSVVTDARRDRIQELSPVESVERGIELVKRAESIGLPVDLAGELYETLFKVQLRYLLSTTERVKPSELRWWLHAAASALEQTAIQLEQRFELPGLVAGTLPGKLRVVSWRIPRGVKPEDRVWYSAFPSVVVNQLGMQLCLVPPGVYMMGRYDGPPEEGPPHRVTLTQPFYLARFELHVAAYAPFSESRLSKKLYLDPEAPMRGVAIVDAMRYCNWLSTHAGMSSAYAGGDTNRSSDWTLDPSSASYRLPTEAEWEYVCQYQADKIRDTVWHADRSGGAVLVPTQEVLNVTRTASNALGVYFMRGNLREWVSDWFRVYVETDQQNPYIPYFGAEASGSGRHITRGGSFQSPAHQATPTTRTRVRPDIAAPDDVGIRLLLPLPTRQR